jgi:hypothetical protein
MLAGVSFFGGTSVVAHQLTEVALDTLAVAAIGLVGREVVSDRVGVIAAVLAAVYPGCGRPKERCCPRACTR